MLMLVVVMCLLALVLYYFVKKFQKLSKIQWLSYDY